MKNKYENEQEEVSGKVKSFDLEFLKKCSFRVGNNSIVIDADGVHIKGDAIYLNSEKQ